MKNATSGRLLSYDLGNLGRGDTVIVTGDRGEYVFERRGAAADHPFEGLDNVFGAVTLPRDNTSLREKVRRRLASKDRRRRRRTA